VRLLPAAGAADVLSAGPPLIPPTPFPPLMGGKGEAFVGLQAAGATKTTTH